MNNHPSAILIAGLLLSVALYLAGYALLEGDFVRHMLAHIIIMGPIACLCAIFLLNRARVRRFSAIFQRLWLATVVQILLFLTFHAPFVHHHLHAPVAFVITVMVMLAVSSWYWCTILHAGHARCWQAILSLLVTGKLFCLLAILIIFSPRSLYSGVHHLVAMDEQQLAGLLMIVACPLSYVVTAIVLSARWLNQLERDVQVESANVGGSNIEC